MDELNIGTIVTSFYKTGKYIGEVMEVRPNGYLVKVLAVLKHPMQGDLHHPKEVEGVMFHERRALTYLEKAVVPFSQTKVFEDAVPEYKESLKNSLDKMKIVLQATDSEFNKMSLRNLDILSKEYGL